VIESGSIRQLISLARHPYTFALLRAVPDPDLPVHRLLTIPGQPPDLTAVPAGCSFAPRCALAEPACREVDPALMAVPEEPDHGSACIRLETASQWLDWTPVDVPDLLEKT
jgi:oligopeptide/dipeptide ABC transporter ATP-binding protein